LSVPGSVVLTGRPRSGSLSIPAVRAFSRMGSGRAGAVCKRSPGAGQKRAVRGMIIGVGVDIAELDRIARSHRRFGEKFSSKILTPAEMALVPANAVPFLASRFAAKEAAVKALGTGFSGGITFQDIEIRSDALGKPMLFFHGQAELRCLELQVRAAHVTLSHGRENAVAMVILEG